jgi:flagella basal body P-ring formation protein FlgA
MTIRRNIAVLLILVGSFLPAVAGEQPRLRAEVTVSSDFVRLGDLLDNAGPAANEPVFRAPDLGTTGTVQAARVLAAARAKRIEAIDDQGLAEVAVTRASRTVSLDEISRALSLAIIRQNGLGADADLAVTFDSSVRPAQIEPGLAGQLQVTRIAWSPGSGRFDAMLAVEGSTVMLRSPLRVGGMAVETVAVPVYTRALARGDVIRAADVMMQRLPRSQAQSDAVNDPAAAIGQAVRRTTRPGQLVATSDLTKPEIIGRNDPITLVYETPGIVLSIRAKALQAGADGDVIPVLNIQSNRVVQATVTGPGRVSVILRPRLASN